VTGSLKKIERAQLSPANIKLSPANIERAKQEESVEITWCIINTTKVREPLFVTYLSDQDSSKDDCSDSCTSSKQASKTRGTAVKVAANKWHIHLDGEISMTATNADLMDGNKFFVEKKLICTDDSTDIEKKRKDTKRKRAHKADQHEKEKIICDTGLAKLREVELSEYNNLKTRFQSGKDYQFEEFLEMIDRIWKPLLQKLRAMKCH